MTSLFFIGRLFLLNKSLQQHIISQIENDIGFCNTLSFYQESDTIIFLELEQALQKAQQLCIVSTPKSFSIIGKLLCTITQDNQVVKENLLLPSKSEIYSSSSYLLHYNQTQICVMQADEAHQSIENLLHYDVHHGYIHLFQSSKQEALTLLTPLAQSFDVTLNAYYLCDNCLKIEILSNKYGNVTQFIQATKQLLPKQCIAAESLLNYLVQWLKEKNRKITFAESCTGGLLSAMLTEISGASTIFEGSLVTYSNTMKANWLAVEHETLEHYGAVSEEVVQQMSDGAMNVSYAHYAIAISGIAGPTGGSNEKPVGTVCIDVRSKASQLTRTFHFSGERKSIQEQSALNAIALLFELEEALFLK